MAAKTATEARRNGVIHRDLKPAHILIDADGRPRVADFGLVRRHADDITRTAEGLILGTPAYMAPEQARGENRSVDARADVYGLGTILYEMLAGKRPFRGDGCRPARPGPQQGPHPPAGWTEVSRPTWRRSA